ncbi:MAG: hypothetical protein IKN83_05085 [Bacteroidaceae bacterium]|nr:hypothetical protein [Bacteroidaceae bacterium]
MGIKRMWKTMYRSLRKLKINREFMVFIVFLLVSIVFWFVQTFKESTTAKINYKLEITDIPSNIILTSDVPKRVEVTVSGRGFSIIDYLTKSDSRVVEVDYSQFEKSDGMLVLNNNSWKKIVTSTLGNSLTCTSISPSMLEIYYSTGEHKYVPVVFGGKAKVDGQHVLCGIELEPQHVDIYAPDNQFDTISAIYTEDVRYTGLKDTTVVRLALVPPKGVKCRPDSITAKLCVDLYTTKTIKVPIFCENIPEDKVIRTFPLTTNVTFRVSSSLYNHITASDFSIVVDYNNIQPNDKKCDLIVRTVPMGISDVTLSPQQVDYIIEQE